MIQQVPSFQDRVRFNWGFHDGSREAQCGSVRDMSRHFDPVYAAGYVRGVNEFQARGERPPLSDEAWEQYRRDGS